MSLKVTTFSNFIKHPKTIDRFVVLIPTLFTSVMTVHATTLPHEVMQESIIWYQGQPVYVPTRSKVPGLWKCTLYEDSSMVGGIMINAAKALVRDNRFIPQDIIIALLDQQTGKVPVWLCVLRNSWLQSIDPVSLDWSKPDTPLQWELSFRYNSILSGADAVSAFSSIVTTAAQTF